MSSLAPVLSPGDLPATELQAARLDGDVYPLGGAYCLIGELEAPRHRARAVLGGRSPRLIAELRTAAWIWGAAPDLGRLRFAVSPDARTRLALGSGHVLREIVHADEDVLRLDGFPVTSPLRTVLDLVRSDDEQETDLHAVVARLLGVGGLTSRDCLASLDARPGIPAREAVRERLTRVLVSAEP